MPLLSTLKRLLLALAVAALATARADGDLPSPPAMALGERIVPRDLVRGFVDGLATEAIEAALGGRVPAARAPAVRARARRAMDPALDEAFPPEWVAGICAQFVSRRYTPEELRALSDWEASPLGQKLRAFDARSRAVVAADPATADRAREALAAGTFSDEERKAIAAFAATPLAAKGRALAPELTGEVLDQLAKRLVAVKPTLEAKLRSAAEAVLATE